jgi:23S rRNA (uracil1939-C5)-methyltransferase/tRNA (uracil-5-)-methyltransferase
LVQSFYSRLDALAGSGSDGQYPIGLPGDVATIFAGLPSLTTPESPDAFSSVETAVIIDPPRKCCDESFLAQLFAFAPRTVVYVS